MAKGQKKIVRRRKKYTILISILNVLVFTVVIGLAVFTAVSMIRNGMGLRLSYWLPLLAFLALCVISFRISYTAVSNDPLTGLLSAEQYQIKVIQKTITRTLPRYCGIFMNTKNFRYVNSMLGVPGGDEVLQKYAKYLKKNLVRGEFLGRMGGDNFTGLIYKHRVDEFLRLAQKADIPVMVEGQEKTIALYTRIGVYALKEGDSLGELMQSTSLAMQYAKENAGQDVVWFEQKLQQKFHEDEEIIYSFNSALQGREFQVYYQPKVDVSDNHIFGLEALVRWKRDGKVLLPKDFLPALEKSGRISELDFYVMNQICEDFNRWLEAGVKPLQISVNFSRTHLLEKNFADRIVEILGRHHMDRQWFQLELTESSSVEDYTALQEFLKRMSYERISVAIDDFGVGYSSLDLLKNENVDLIKIDQRFMEGIDSNGGSNENAYLVRNIIHTCFDMHKKILCEGVETKEQKELLKSMRCTYMQGYLFEAPLPKAELLDRLKKGFYE